MPRIGWRKNNPVEQAAEIEQERAKLVYPKSRYEPDVAILVDDARQRAVIEELKNVPDPTAKPSNPKDAIGSDKMPYHLWPNTATIYGCLGLLDGMLKYGRSNWREAGVRFTIYYDAAKRHADKLSAGEDIDPDSGLPHECHILACWAIIVDAKAAGRFIDDREYRGGGFLNLLKDMTPHVKRLKEKYLGKNPKHWTIADNPSTE